MRSIIAKIKQPLCLRRNHLFHFEKDMSLDARLKPLPEEMQLIYPCAFNTISPTMFDEAEGEYRGIQDRIRLGDKLGIIVLDDKIVHRSVVQTSGTAAMEGDPRAIQLGDGEIYIHWCETLGSFSCAGLYSTMLRRILQYSKTDASFQKAYIACRQDNIASIKGVLKAGFEYCKSSRAISVLGGAVSHSNWYRVRKPPQLMPDRGYAI